MAAVAAAAAAVAAAAAAADSFANTAIPGSSYLRANDKSGDFLRKPMLNGGVMKLAVLILSIFLACVEGFTGLATAMDQKPEGCVEYFLRIVPTGENISSDFFTTHTLYCEIFDSNAKQVLDRNKVGTDGTLNFKFCLSAQDRKLALRCRLGNPENSAVTMPLNVDFAGIRATGLHDPQVVRFDPNEIMGITDTNIPKEQNRIVAVPVRFAHCSGILKHRPKGILLVEDTSGNILAKADSRSEVIPLDCRKTNHITFLNTVAGKTYQIRPHSVTPMLLNRFFQEPFEIEVIQVRQKEVTLNFDGLMPGRNPQIEIRDNGGFARKLAVDAGHSSIKLMLGLPCDESSTYALRVLQDRNYAAANYSFDLTDTSPQAYTVSLKSLSSVPPPAPVATGPPQYFFLINIAGRQMHKNLNLIKDSLKGDEKELKKLTGDHVQFFMAFEGTVRQTNLEELYFDPSVHENLPTLLKNFSSALPRDSRNHLIYITSSGRTMRYRTDLPKKARTRELSERYNITFSAVVIGEGDSRELQKMADMGNGFYKSVPAGSPKNLAKVLRELITKLN